MNAKVCARMLRMAGWRRSFQVKKTLGNPVGMALLLGGGGVGEHGDWLGAGQGSLLLGSSSGKHSGVRETLVPLACPGRPGPS